MQSISMANELFLKIYLLNVVQFNLGFVFRVRSKMKLIKMV